MAGRSKDMIIRGGENIQPTEIENVITSMESVQDCYDAVFRTGGTFVQNFTP